MKSTEESFLKLDLAELLINIWSYSQSKSFIVNTYHTWCIRAARKKWLRDYLDFFIFFLTFILIKNIQVVINKVFCVLLCLTAAFQSF